MLYGKRYDKNVQATPRTKAECPACKSRLVAKCGDIKIWHWAHENVKDCDTWSEGETEWHLNWKRIVRPENSPISPGEIIERERFYNKLVWVFNVSRSAQNFSLRLKEGYVTFRWKWGWHTLSYVTKPMFLDFDNRVLLEVKKMYNDERVAGWGYIHSREQFIDTYLKAVLI